MNPLKMKNMPTSVVPTVECKGCKKKCCKKYKKGKSQCKKCPKPPQF
jgi:hypothetical protein